MELHKIELYHSLLSGKKKLCVDAKQICELKDYKANFNHSFKIGRHYFNIYQLAYDIWELKIDNIKFKQIKENKTEQKEEEEEHKIYAKDEINTRDIPDDEFFDFNFDFTSAKKNKEILKQNERMCVNITEQKRKEESEEIQQKMNNEILFEAIFIKEEPLVARLIEKPKKEKKQQKQFRNEQRK